MPEVEKRMEETSWRIRKKGSYMASFGREKVASRLAHKQKSNNTAAQIFQDNRNRSKRKNKGKRSKVEANK